MCANFVIVTKYQPYILRNKSINWIIYAAFITITLLCIIYFTSRYQYFADQERKLIPIQFVGRINSLRDLNRGTYYVKVVTQDSAIELQSLPIAYDVNRTKLRIGDSVSKNRNSEKIQFFRSDFGKRSNLFEYQIAK